ncbi:MAG: site-specific integrase, partial [Nocardioidaceae bacterium]|nr:site-specific integrase [Nocardioidaceae bacterium]
MRGVASEEFHAETARPCGVPDDHRWPDLCEPFLAGLRANTARAYRSDLAHMAAWFAAADASSLSLNDALLLRYFRHLAGSGYSYSTARRRLTCVRALAAFAAQRGQVLSLDLDSLAAELNPDPPSVIS